MRLFIAINFPSDVRQRLWDATAALRRDRVWVRWVAPDDLHLTVKFLGRVEAKQCPAIEAGLRQVVDGTAPFPLPIEGVGAFPTPRRPRVVWVGCEALPALELLHDATERTMATLGFALTGRPFRPHITLGRVAREVDRAAAADLGRALAGIVCAAEPLVESVDLMESHPRRAGARYTTLTRAELAA